ncbi:PAS domain-containing protein [Agrobacterium tumefaciens]|nr:PAS domain-containing protein [Agrobacterium tumefaciens]
MAAPMPRPLPPFNINPLLTLTNPVGTKIATPQNTDVRMDMMSQKRTWRDAMKSMAGLDIYAYWDELRGKRSAPRREDIDPAKLKHHLGDLFILTDKGENTPFFRLAGTRLCDLFGRELRIARFRNCGIRQMPPSPAALPAASFIISCPWSSISRRRTAMAPHRWHMKCCSCRCARIRTPLQGCSGPCLRSGRDTNSPRPSSICQ